MTFVIIGAGPTGVEMAGALAEISRRVLERDFRRIDPSRARIILIEAGPRGLPAVSTESSAGARRQLERRRAGGPTAFPLPAGGERAAAPVGAPTGSCARIIGR